MATHMKGEIDLPQKRQDELREMNALELEDARDKFVDSLGDLAGRVMAAEDAVVALQHDDGELTPKMVAVARLIAMVSARRDVREAAHVLIRRAGLASSEAVPTSALVGR